MKKKWIVRTAGVDTLEEVLNEVETEKYEVSKIDSHPRADFVVIAKLKRKRRKK